MAEEHEEPEPEPEPTEPGDADVNPEQLGFDPNELNELGADDLEEDDEEEDLEEDDDEEEGHPEPEVTIEVSGLSLYTHMGVSEAERQLGQRLIVDVRLDIGESDRRHRRLRRGLRDHQPCRPAAQLQDARALLRRGRGPPDRALRDPRRLGEGR
jgi:hypothetical protein